MESGRSIGISRDEEVEAHGGGGRGAVSSLSQLHKGSRRAVIASAADRSHH